jgi:glycosyltransferase involved in cell wall biosynthesis
MAAFTALRACMRVLDRLEGYWGGWLAKVSRCYLQDVGRPSREPIGRALLIYIVHPFTKPLAKRHHTNRQEALTIVKVLAGLGYVVDVLDYRYPFRINASMYRLVLGFGDNYEKLFYGQNSSIMIHYATGAPQSIHCLAEATRIREFMERNGLRLTPRRLLDRTWPCSEILSDAIICGTEGWAKRQYQTRHEKVFHVRLMYLGSGDMEVIPIRFERKRPNHFVWFGSVGGLHKGLDLCLDALKKRGDFILHICGPIQNERDLFDYYSELLVLHPNVKLHGFVDVDSEKMRLLMEEVSFAILPSCSEGGGAGVLTCMAWGCIPVITEQCGVTYPKAVRIEKLTVDAVSLAISRCLSMSDTERLAIINDCIAWIRTNHTLEAYKESLGNALRTILGHRAGHDLEV